MKASEIMQANLKTVANMQNSSMVYRCPDCGTPVVDAEITIPVIGKKVIVPRYGCQCLQNKEIKKCIGEDGITRNKDIFEASGVGKRFKHCTFENFKPYFEVKQAFETVAEYTERFEHYKETGTGLILKGGPGCGKSHLAAALCQELILKGYIVKFALVPIILDDIRKSYGKKPAEGEQDILKQMAEVELLVLDDMGAEKSTPWVIEQMFILINRRYEAMKPTVITTNCTGQELADRIGERSASRLLEISKVININAPDYRLRKKRSEEK